MAKEKKQNIFIVEGSSDKAALENIFKKILRDSKVKEYNFHVLRHTFATNCIKVGMDIKSLSEILGHSSVDVTLNRYVHSSYEMKKKYLQKL